MNSSMSWWPKQKGMSTTFGQYSCLIKNMLTKKELNTCNLLFGNWVFARFQHPQFCCHPSVQLINTCKHRTADMFTNQDPSPWVPFMMRWLAWAGFIRWIPTLQLWETVGARCWPQPPRHDHLERWFVESCRRRWTAQHGNNHNKHLGHWRFRLDVDGNTLELPPGSLT